MLRRQSASLAVYVGISLWIFALFSSLPASIISGKKNQTLPKLKVLSVTRVFHNGEHNAFTDLCRYQDRFHLTFRSCPDGHAVHSTAKIIVLSSKNGQDWNQVHSFHVPKRDTRDPHFLIFKNKLFVITGTWYCGGRTPAPADYTLNKHLGYAAWSPDGKKWHGPQMLEGTYGHYVWRAASHGDKAYLCGRRIREFAEVKHADSRKITESAMLESDDGLVWCKAALFQEEFGNETAFLFEPGGGVLAVARRIGNAELCRSRPPYTDWKRGDLGQYIGGPLLAKWGDYYLVGGRKKTKQGYKTALHWLVDGKLHQCAQLPSGGDNSYPGFVALSPARGLLSYYSSHEKDDNGKSITAIYLAELEMEN